MFTLTLVDLEYETSVSLWEFEMMTVLKWYFCPHFISLYDYIHKTMKLSLLINSGTLFFFMNIDISSWHNWCFDLTKMLFFALFQFLTRLLTSKHLKLFSTYLVGRNERCEIRAFQLLKLRKNKIIWNIKTKCVTDILLTARFSSVKDYICHYVVST